MSLTTITQASKDMALLDRIDASAWKEAISNPEFGDTPFGKMVLSGTAAIHSYLAYPVAVDTEVAYEYAVNEGNPNPGGDPSVITDAAIGSAVQVHWPELPEPPA